MLKRMPYRGGNWNNAASAGAFALNCNNARSNSNTNIGARPDSKSPRTALADGGFQGDVFLHLAQAFAKSAGHFLPSRRTNAFERLKVIL